MSDTTTAIPQTLEDLRGQTPEQLFQTVEVLDAHIRSLHQTESGELRDLDAAGQQALALCLEIRKAAMAKLEEHRAISNVLSQRPEAVQRAYQSIRHGLESPDNTIRMTIAEARDRALRVLENRDSSAHLDASQKDQLDRVIRRNTDIARRIVVTENEAYRDAFLKLVTQPHAHALLSDEERQAVRAYEEYRVMSEGTTTAGGFGIPVFIDPSIIMTAQGSPNPFLRIARSVDVNTNAWKGVSSAGVSWSFDSENSEVSDDSPVLAQPTVNVYTARGFIPYSIELGQDYPGFAAEMGRLLAEGYDELLVDKFTRGTGSGEPQGILTVLSANTNVRVTLTTAPTIGAPDPYKVWQALPLRYQGNASWLMSVSVNNAIRQLGTANVYHATTVGLPAAWADVLFNSGVYASPYMPDTTTVSTATIGLAVVGDFSNFVLARRGGMSVELIPTLFGVTTGRPMGQRGWFAYARIGSGASNPLGFRLLVNA